MPNTIGAFVNFVSGLGAALCGLVWITIIIQAMFGGYSVLTATGTSWAGLGMVILFLVWLITLDFNR